jgi:CHAD domain-containing protein
MPDFASDPRTFMEHLAATQPHEVEHAHLVTLLALRLFDALRPMTGWTGNDRLVLEAAARLHDIGYADDPADHSRAGAHRIMRTKPAGFSREDLRRVMAVVLLHSSRPGGDSLLPIPPGLLRDKTVRQLGVLLRVADGLDHSHLQDTCITRIALTHDEMRVYLTTAPNSRNADKARSKADFWPDVMPVRLTLINRPRPDYVLIRPSDSTGEALRRLILVHDRELADALRRTAEEDSEESLHDLRIALRCLRRLLGAFARPLRDTSAAGIERKLRELTDAISPARDLDVGQIILNKHRVRQAMRNVPGWDRFVQRQRRERNEARRALRGLMAAPGTRLILHQLGYLLRIELPAAARSKRPIGEEALRWLKEARERARSQRKLASSKNGDRLHDLRIAIRRYRLLADLLAPALGRPALRLARRLRLPEKKLGRLHDLDVARARYKKMDDPVARALADVLRVLRQRQHQRFLAVWSAFHWKDPRDPV